MKKLNSCSPFPGGIELSDFEKWLKTSLPFQESHSLQERFGVNFGQKKKSQRYVLLSP